MAKNDNLKDFVTDIADAIREKKGTTDLINPQNFSSEILSIETEGSSNNESNQTRLELYGKWVRPSFFGYNYLTLYSDGTFDYDGGYDLSDPSTLNPDHTASGTYRTDNDNNIYLTITSSSVDYYTYNEEIKHCTYNSETNQLKVPYDTEDVEEGQEEVADLLHSYVIKFNVEFLEELPLSYVVGYWKMIMTITNDSGSTQNEQYLYFNEDYTVSLIQDGVETNAGISFSIEKSTINLPFDDPTIPINFAYHSTEDYFFAELSSTTSVMLKKLNPKNGL